jgi:hypothetical protein
MTSGTSRCRQEKRFNIALTHCDADQLSALDMWRNRIDPMSLSPDK